MDRPRLLLPVLLLLATHPAPSDSLQTAFSALPTPTQRAGDYGLVPVSWLTGIPAPATTLTLVEGNSALFEVVVAANCAALLVGGSAGAPIGGTSACAVAQGLDAYGSAAPCPAVCVNDDDAASVAFSFSFSATPATPLSSDGAVRAFPVGLNSGVVCGGNAVNVSNAWAIIPAVKCARAAFVVAATASWDDATWQASCGRGAMAGLMSPYAGNAPNGSSGLLTASPCAGLDFEDEAWGTTVRNTSLFVLSAHLTITKVQVSATASTTPSISATLTPSTTTTLTATKTETPSSTRSGTDTPSPTSSISLDETPSVTPAVAAVTPTSTMTVTPTPTTTVSETATTTSTASLSPSPTRTPTATITATRGQAANFRVVLLDADDPPVLLWLADLAFASVPVADALALASALGVSATAGALTKSGTVVDDSPSSACTVAPCGAFVNSSGILILTDQDESDAGSHTISLMAASPLDFALEAGGLNLSALIKVIPLGAPRRISMAAFSLRSQQLLLGCSDRTPSPTAFTFARAFFITPPTVAAANALQRVPARDLLFSASVYTGARGASGAGTAAPAPVVRVDIRRSSSSFALIASASGTYSAFLVPDSGETVSISLVSASLNAIPLSATFISSYFSLTAGAPMMTQFTDIATNATVVAPIVRNATLVFGCAALLASESDVTSLLALSLPPWHFTVNASATSDGSFRRVHSALPPAPPPAVMATTAFSAFSSPPLITSLSLPSLSSRGGETLVITGTGFLPLWATSVTIGGVTVAVTSSALVPNLPTTIDCFAQSTGLIVTTPQGAGTVALTVTIAGRTSPPFFISYIPPTMTLSPFSQGIRSGSNYVLRVLFSSLSICAACPNGVSSCPSLKTAPDVPCALPSPIPTTGISFSIGGASAIVTTLSFDLEESMLPANIDSPPLPAASVAFGVGTTRTFYAPPDSYVEISTPFSSGVLTASFDTRMGWAPAGNATALTREFNWLLLSGYASLPSSVGYTSDKPPSPTSGGGLTIIFRSGVIGNPGAVVITSKPTVTNAGTGDTTLNTDGLQAPPGLCLFTANTSFSFFPRSAIVATTTYALYSPFFNTTSVWVLSATVSARSLTPFLSSPVMQSFFLNRIYLRLAATAPSSIPGFFSPVGLAARLVFVSNTSAVPTGLPAGWWEVPLSTLLPTRAAASISGGPPCSITAWESNTNGGSVVTLSMPPWQGPFWVSIYSDGGLIPVTTVSAPTVAAGVSGMLTTQPPTISNVSCNTDSCSSLPAGGDTTINIAGDLGHVSLGRLFNALTEYAPLLRASIGSLPLVKPLPTNASIDLGPRSNLTWGPYPDDLGSSFATVRVSPSVAYSLARGCNITSRGSSSGRSDLSPITCLTPAGIPGSLNDVAVLWNATFSSNSTVDGDVAFDTANKLLGSAVVGLSNATRVQGSTWTLKSSDPSPSLSYATPAFTVSSTSGSFPADGDFDIILSGSNMGEGGTQVATRLDLASLLALGALPPALALSAPSWSALVNQLQWSYSLFVSAVAGAGSVGGNAAMTLGLVGTPAPPVPRITPISLTVNDTVRIASWRDSLIIFTMPPFEGTVNLTLIFAWLPTTIKPTLPKTSSVLITADAPQIYSVRVLKLPGDGPLADPCLELSNTAPDSCVAEARAVYDWGAYTSDLPCLQATEGDGLLGSQSRVIELSGTGFGWGWDVNARVQLDNVTSQVVCNTPSVTLGASGASTLFCVLDAFPAPASPALLPSEPTALNASAFSIGGVVAFQTLKTEDGTDIQAACACGSSVSPLDGSCEPCPTGATCPGALIPSFANGGYWKVTASQWVARNAPESVIATLPPFVTCATPARCLANSRCSLGSDPASWECTKCISGYAPDSAGNCAECPTPEQLLLYIVVVPLLFCLFVLGGIMWYLAGVRAPRGRASACCKMYSPTALASFLSACVTRVMKLFEGCKRSRPLTVSTAANAKVDTRTLPSLGTLFKIATDFLQPLGYVFAVTKLDRGASGLASPTLQRAAMNATATDGSTITALLRSPLAAFGTGMSSVQDAFALGSASMACLNPDSTFLSTLGIWITLPWILFFGVFLLWLTLCVVVDSALLYSPRDCCQRYCRVTVTNSSRIKRDADDDSDETLAHKTYAYVRKQVSDTNLLYVAMFLFGLSLPTAINSLIDANVCSGGYNNFLLVDPRVSCWDTAFTDAQGTFSHVLYFYFSIPALFLLCMITCMRYEGYDTASAWEEFRVAPWRTCHRVPFLVWLWISLLILSLLRAASPEYSACSPLLLEEEEEAAPKGGGASQEGTAATLTTASAQVIQPASPWALWWAPLLLLRTLILGGLSKKCFGNLNATTGLSCSAHSAMGAAFVVLIALLLLLAFSLQHTVPFRSPTTNFLLFLSTTTHLVSFSTLIDETTGYSISIAFTAIFVIAWLIAFAGLWFPRMLLWLQGGMPTFASLAAAALLRVGGKGTRPPPPLTATPPPAASVGGAFLHNNPLRNGFSPPSSPSVQTYLDTPPSQPHGLLEEPTPTSVNSTVNSYMRSPVTTATPVADGSFTVANPMASLRRAHQSSRFASAASPVSRGSSAALRAAALPSDTP